MVARHGRRAAPYVTGNVSLWPETAVLIANPGRLAGLSARQRNWLSAAAAGTAARSTALAVAAEADAVENVCAHGARFATASAGDLAAMRDAFAPVNASLRADPEVRDLMDRIQRLKAGVPVPSFAVPSGCGSAPTPATPAGPDTSLVGTWRTAPHRSSCLAL